MHRRGYVRKRIAARAGPVEDQAPVPRWSRGGLTYGPRGRKTNRRLRQHPTQRHLGSQVMWPRMREKDRPEKCWDANTVVGNPASHRAFDRLTPLGVAFSIRCYGWRALLHLESSTSEPSRVCSIR